ncbi:hypothetical protein [Thermococcus sp. 21S9]|uniref:hypothetical protein n=1 Tax=Thermococcus sp. 21S9 TaxID=1638223 RepID=UPI00143B9E1E|nr:hypothetical protein [Thermococcus sp. 21S9]
MSPLRFRVSTNSLKLAVLVLLLPLAWLASLTDVVRFLAGNIGTRLGIPAPSLLLGLVFVIVPALIYVYLTGDLLRPFLLALVLYLLPAIFGIDINLLDRYVPGAIVLFMGFLLALFITWLEGDVKSVEGEEGERLFVSSLREVLVPLPLGIMLIVLLLWRSSLGKTPRNVLPLAFLLPLLLFATVAFALHFREDRNEKVQPAKKSYLILRTTMKAGDSFILDVSERMERSVTFTLSGGFPVERPILLKLEWDDEAPEVIVLMSPWDTRTLLKAEELRKGEEVYFLYLPTSRAPSSQGIPSAPL